MAIVETKRIVDLSHVIEHGMTTYAGLPAPHICDFWTREKSAEYYDDGSSFQIGRIDMVANTGTYLDSPFHRLKDGKDLSKLPLTSIADLPGILVSRPWGRGLAIGPDAFEGFDLRGHAVLVRTGWDRHWRTDQYFKDHPFLTAQAAQWLADHGAACVGIDSYNIDDTRERGRPVHSILLASEIPICEHMCALEELGAARFRFSAVPAKIRGMGSFPVRAYAVLD